MIWPGTVGSLQIGREDRRAKERRVNSVDLRNRDVTAFSMLTVEQANEFLHKRQKSFEKTENGYKCKECGSTIMQTTLYVSIHDSRFSACAGSGEVQRVNFPFCPQCEGEPSIVRGCVHV